MEVAALGADAALCGVVLSGAEGPHPAIPNAVTAPMPTIAILMLSLRPLKRLWARTIHRAFPNIAGEPVRPKQSSIFSVFEP
ncbi:hypothetical protein D3C83_181120 [compost metagenome]